MIKAIIIEDELKGLLNLQNLLLQYCENVQLVGQARSLEEAYALVDKLQDGFDLAFLDISLPDGLIFQFLDEIKPIDFDVIFVTAYDKYAIQACEYSSIGYVLKPINPDSLAQAVNRVRLGRTKFIDSRLDVFKGVYNNPNAFEKMSVSALDGIYFLNIKDILRLEAEDNYTHIFLKSGEKITASKTIKSYEELLLEMNFYRVHKRHVINLNYMRKFVKGDGGYVVMDDDIRIEVSRRRRPAFMEQMKRLQTVI